MSRNFDGVDDVLLATILALDSGDWTMGAWVRADSAGEGDDGQMFEGATTGNASRQIFRIFDNTLIIRGAQIFSTTNASVTTTTALTLATWSLVFLTFRASDAKLRVYFGTRAAAMAEGSYSGQVAGVGTRQTGGTQLRVGNNSGTTGTFDGLISHAVVAAREWSLWEMEAYRHRGVPLNYASLRGFWPLWGAASPEPDLSGNAANLTVTGAVAGAGAPLSPYGLGDAWSPDVVAGDVTIVMDAGAVAFAGGTVTPAAAVVADAGPAAFSGSDVTVAIDAAMTSGAVIFAGGDVVPLVLVAADAGLVVFAGGDVTVVITQDVTIVMQAGEVVFGGGTVGVFESPEEHNTGLFKDHANVYRREFRPTVNPLPMRRSQHFPNRRRR